MARGIKLPKFLGNLMLQIFDSEGKLRCLPSVEAILAVRQILGGMKKLLLPCSTKATREAIREYEQIEIDMEHPTLNWGKVYLQKGTNLGHISFANKPKKCPHRRDHKGRFQKWEKPDWSSVLQSVSDRVAAQFGDMHKEHETELPRHGPGVVANLSSKEGKYSFPMWNRRLNAFFPADLYAIPSFGLAEDSISWTKGLREIECPSRLISVPKTQKGPRLIAAEPVENQWIQQLLLKQFELRTPRTSIAECVDFRSQTRNQEFARLGSIDGSLATVDLSSASDRLSCWTVERIFRSNLTLLERLNACRTVSVKNAVTSDSFSTLNLKKMSPMGSAVTFPVQSVVYAIMAVASILYSTGSKVSSSSIKKASNQVSVFGDDIIVPVSALGTLKAMLHHNGLKVNESKTFGTGKFRESCGSDYFSGEFITPTKVTELPCKATVLTSYSSLLEVGNNFHRAGLWNVSTFLLSLIPEQYRKVLPRANMKHGLGTFVYSFCGNEYPAASRRRWNSDLQRWERQSWRLYKKDVRAVDGPVERFFQWLIDRPSPDTLWVPGRSVRTVSYWRLGWSDERFNSLEI
jgi:hypothetical protein